MGDKKRKLEQFIRQHPLCCFCGGRAITVTQDHLPPRSIFVEKKWPEGYTFPACEACNLGSSRDDAMVAFLSRWNAGREPTQTDSAEWKRLLAAFREHHPAAVREMIMSANEKRRWMAMHGVDKPAGLAYAEMPLLRIPSVIRDAVERFNIKLCKALHYKHTGKIVPEGAWIYAKWWTNAHVIAKQFPADITKFVPHRAELKRGRVSLLDQFEYRHEVSENGELGVYVSVFRVMFCLVALVSFDPSLMHAVDQQAIESSIDNAGR